MTELSRGLPNGVLRFPVFTLLENWDMAPPKVRKPTRLFPLRPIGIGTPLVEGLASYLTSLAAEHSISVRNLIRDELLPLTASASLDGKVEVKQFEYWKRINGMADITSEMVSALEIATGLKEFQCMSMLRFGGHILPDIASAQRRWCSYCLDEFQSKGRVFEPLLWSLAAVLACPFHGCELTELCAKCTQTSMLLQNHMRPGHCPHCGAWLGRARDPNALALPTQDSSEVKRARMVGDVLAIPQMPPQVGGKSLAFINLKHCIAAVTDGNVLAFSEMFKLSAHDLWDYHNYIPKLGALATIAAQIDVPLTKFFEYESESQSWRDVAARTNPQVRETVMSLEKVRDHLRKALAESPAPRLCTIANRVGFCNSDALRRIDGDLTAQIHRRFLESVRRGEQRYRGATRISQKVDIVRSLRRELGKEKPDSLAAIARRLGYACPTEIRRIYPDLCDEISAKLKGRRARRLEMERDELEGILREDIAPNLHEVSKRLGYSSDTMLRENHPELCASILARYREQRADHLTTKAAIVEEFLNRPSVTVQEIFAVIGNQRRFFRRTFPELYRRVMAKAEEVLLRKRAEEIEKAENTVRRVFDELASSGTHVSNTEVMRRLPSEPYLWSKNVARIIRKIRMQAGSKMGSSQ